MRKKRRIFMLIAVITGLFAIAVFQTWGHSESKDKNLYEKLGENIAEHAKEGKLSALDADEDIFMEGKQAVITNRELGIAIDFYIISGDTEEAARNKAIKYLKQRNALYVKAVKEGQDVTEDEIWAYLNEMKMDMKNSQNASDIQALIDQFDSEEDYWNYEFTVYQKNLPIQKYVEVLKQSFAEETNQSDSMDTAEFNEGFLNYYEEYKRELVDAENYQLAE